MSTNRGHWFWSSGCATAQYQREHGKMPWPEAGWGSANASSGGDPAIIGWQRDSEADNEWLDRAVLVAFDFNWNKGRWRQVLCLPGGRADLDLLWAP